MFFQGKSPIFLRPVAQRICIIKFLRLSFSPFHFLSDYSTSELDWRYNFNFSTAFIDFFSMFGWAYDLKRISPTAVQQRVDRTGDHFGHEEMLQQKYGESMFKSLAIATAHIYLPVLIRVLFLTTPSL